jgi:hypothetical protein
MCFSPLASFTTAGLTGVIGVAAMSRVRLPSELPLAAAPLFFAIQQAIEGVLWLRLPVAPHGETTGLLVVGFLFLAEVFWPFYAPLAAYLAEPDRNRRAWMVPVLVLGAAVSALLLWYLAAQPHSARIIDHHIIYATEPRHSSLIELGYLAAVTLGLLLSSHRAVIAFGLIVLAGAASAYLAYHMAGESVWCFFAAMGSAVLLFHFERARRRAGKLASVSA